jgi:hypothetical protein
VHGSGKTVRRLEGGRRRGMRVARAVRRAAGRAREAQRKDPALKRCAACAHVHAPALCRLLPGAKRPAPCGKPVDRSVSRTGRDSGCCTGDGSRPPEVGLQEQASNRPVLLRSKGVVVSDRGKVARQGRKVRFEKMSASKPSDEASLTGKVLSKPRSFCCLGTNWGVTCLRTQWQPV